MFRSFEKNAKERKRTQKNARMLHSFEKNVCTTISEVTFYPQNQATVCTDIYPINSIYLLRTYTFDDNEFTEQKIRSDIREEKKQHTQPPIVNIHIQKQ